MVNFASWLLVTCPEYRLSSMERDALSLLQSIFAYVMFFSSPVTVIGLPRWNTMPFE